MVQIKPRKGEGFLCLGNNEIISAHDLLWQGIHIGAIGLGPDGELRRFRDLPVGHSAHWPYEVGMDAKELKGPAGVEWLSQPLFESILSPDKSEIHVHREILNPSKHVIILNCLDMMYGHCLLKLLNSTRHLEDNPDRGLIVLIPSFLRWLVPDGVAEIWSVPLGLAQMKSFYPSIDRQIKAFCENYESIWLSEAFSHPSRFRIEDFTRIKPHDFSLEQDLVTFIWREDRLWLPHYFAKKLRKLGLQSFALALQRRKVTKVFERLKSAFPETRFAVAGLGMEGRFPKWIEDHRVSRFDEESEKTTAQLYANSRIVAGIHGSNMLLPSSLAGMTLDLVPLDKWNNHPQDAIPAVKDARTGAFLHRFIPAEINTAICANIICSMLRNFRRLPIYLSEDKIA